MEQNVLWSNKITGFFDHQYRWKEAIYALDFLRRDSNQRKTVCKATTIVCVLPCNSSYAQTWLDFLRMNLVSLRVVWTH